jgi:uncharacterized protein (DUF2237 family)
MNFSLSKTPSILPGRRGFGKCLCCLRFVLAQEVGTGAGVWLGAGEELQVRVIFSLLNNWWFGLSM